MSPIILIVVFVIIIFITNSAFVSRYKKDALPIKY